MRRAGVSSALGLAISAASLVAVVWWILRQPAPELPESGLGFAWIGLALLTIACTLVLRGWRWHRVLALAGIPHRRRDAYGLTAVGYMGNNVLPARGGELLKIGLLGERTSARRRELLGTVLADRALDAAVLAAVFAALTFAAVDGAPSGSAGAVAAAGALAVAAAALALYRGLRRRGRLARFSAAIRPVARASRIFAGPQGAPLAGVSLLIWLLEGVTFLAIARAVGVELGVLPALAVVVLASLAAAVPAAPGYVGTFDAALLVGLRGAGVEGGDAVAVLVLCRFVLFVPVTIAGLATLLACYGGLRLRRPPGDREELLAEETPRERRREVATGQRSTGG